MGGLLVDGRSASGWEVCPRACRVPALAPESSNINPNWQQLSHVYYNCGLTKWSRTPVLNFK
jgi:hypothetical protein